VRLKSLSFLLGLLHAGAAPALGLGELSVRSYLGQPLVASVRLLDAGAAARAECFSVAPSEGGITPPPTVRLSVEPRGDQVLLQLRSVEPLYEPVVQFTVIADCDTSLRRDYVLLLDMPPAVSAPQTDSPAASAPAPAAAPPKATRTPRTAAPRASKPAALPVARSARSARAPVARTRAAPPAEPRLVLSGRRLSGTGGFALKLDTTLPDLDRPLPADLTATELSDENTALMRKLAYLEAQLAALQQRNAKLEAQRAQAAAAAPPPAAAARPQWPLYLLLAGLVGGAGVLLLRLRRRETVAPTETLVELLKGTAATPAPVRAESFAAPRPPDAPPPAPSKAAPPPVERMAEVPAPAPVETTEVKDDILDQAEVYMAHGHGELAIHLLQEHLRDAPDESPVPWLLLLDLLHREGDAAGYAAAGAECRRHFNIDVSSPPVSQESGQERGIEAYPHLMERLVEMWRSPDIESFFRDLIYDNRGGTRLGFEPGAYRDILLLRDIAREALPHAA
jgi:hypothetical protein